MNEKIKAEIKKLCTHKSVLNLVLILGAAGILLLFISEFIPAKKEEEPAFEDCADETIESAEERAEEKIRAITRAITGEEGETVELTFQKTSESVFAFDEKEGALSHIVIKKEDGSESLVKLSETMPQINGAVIVCKGGGSAVVREQIISAVTTVFGISAARVCVLEKN